MMVRNVQRDFARGFEIEIVIPKFSSVAPLTQARTRHPMHRQLVDRRCCHLRTGGRNWGRCPVGHRSACWDRFLRGSPSSCAELCLEPVLAERRAHTLHPHRAEERGHPRAARMRTKEGSTKQKRLCLVRRGAANDARVGTYAVGRRGSSHPRSGEPITTRPVPSIILRTRPIPISPDRPRPNHGRVKHLRVFWICANCLDRAHIGPKPAARAPGVGSQIVRTNTARGRADSGALAHHVMSVLPHSGRRSPPATSTRVSPSRGRQLVRGAVNVAPRLQPTPASAIRGAMMRSAHAAASCAPREPAPGARAGDSATGARRSIR